MKNILDVRKFAHRTYQNLEIIEQYHKENEPNNALVVTQLVNSMFGLLIFPQQSFFEMIEIEYNIPYDEFVQKGWPNFKIIKRVAPCTDTLSCLLRYMRNALAHSNILFVESNDGKIKALKLWNITEYLGGTYKDWEIEITVKDLKAILRNFYDIIIVSEEINRVASKETIKVTSKRKNKATKNHKQNEETNPNNQEIKPKIKRMSKKTFKKEIYFVLKKYIPIQDYLDSCGGPFETLTFKNMERLSGDYLPSAAYKYIDWWVQDRHVFADLWNNIGWGVEEVKLNEYVKFKKLKNNNSDKGFKI